MELVAADTVNKPVAPLRQDSPNSNKKVKKAAPPPTDSVTLSTSEAARNSLNKEKSPSIPVSREEMAALFESFSESFRFSVKA